MAAPGLTTVAHIDTNVRRPKPSEFGTYASDHLIDNARRIERT